MLCEMDHIGMWRRFPWRLKSFSRVLWATNELPNLLLGRIAQKRAPLPAGIIDSPLRQWNVPEVVTDQFQPHGAKREVRVREVPVVDSRPVNQLNPAATATPSWSSREQSFRHTKTMQIAGAIGAGTRDL